MYKEKTTDELLTILSEVCIELNARAVGIADHGGKTMPIIEQQGNTVTCIHISSNLGVSMFRESMKNIKTVMFERGTLTDETSLTRFIRKDDSKKDEQE